MCDWGTGIASVLNGSVCNASFIHVGLMFHDTVMGRISILVNCGLMVLCKHCVMLLFFS